MNAEEKKGGLEMKDMAIVTTFKDHKMRQDTISFCKLQAFDPNEVDFHLDFINMYAQIRDGTDHLRIFHGTIPHLGIVKIALLVKIIKNAPRFLFPYEIGSMDPQFVSHWVKESCIQTVACLRKYLFEDAAKERKDRFLLTAKPFAVAFNSERSFRLIERAYTPKEDELS